MRSIADLRARGESSPWRGGLGFFASPVLALAICGLPQNAFGSSDECAVSPASPARPSVRSSAAIESIRGFVENRGQWAPEVRFFARAGGIEATLTESALVFRPAPPEPSSGRPWPAPLVLRLPPPTRKFPSATTTLRGEGPLPTKHHFLVGPLAKHVRDVMGYDYVVYSDVSPGIDLVVRIEQDAASKRERFAYDLLVAPGAKLEEFELAVEGATGLEGTTSGSLAMQTAAGLVEQRIGACWQEGGASEGSTPAHATFRIAAEGALKFGFAAPGRDPARAFVLDPSLAWATYLGGPAQELLQDIAVDGAGATYVACLSHGAMPTTPGAIQSTSLSVADAWVGKLSADGSTLLVGTFLGGTATDVVYGVDVDHDGSIVLFGNTWSADFPTTPGCLQSSAVGFPFYPDLFVTRLAPDGGSIVWSTYYGGPGEDDASVSALFPSGDVLISARPYSATPASTPGAFDTTFDSHKRLLARISADGKALKFQTYFQTSRILDVAIDEQENIYFAGDISLADMPLPATSGAFKSVTQTQDSDGFVAKMNGLGSHLLWATYLGGDSNLDAVWGIAVDPSHAVYAVGQTASVDFPTTQGAFDSTFSPGFDGFVTKLLPGGSGPVWSTLIGSCCGGSGIETDLAVDRAGNVTSGGTSNEPNFPTTPDAIQPNYTGPFPSGDAHLTKYDAFGSALLYSTWYAGTNTDFFSHVEMGPDQNPHLALESYSSNIPVTPGAFDTTYGGGEDVVVAKFTLPPMPWEVLGGGKTGAKDTPNLAGGGWLTPGSAGRISLRGAEKNSSALLFAGLTAINAPILGGTFVPSPQILLSLTTDASGGLDLPFVWPNVSSGIDLYVQVWVADVGATLGYSATNGLKLTSQ